ncbi:MULTISPECIES: MFS transporter [Rhizobium]|uniref:MFS transporter n=1 Tax=Rhizobium TaxID=379 RepID=UPI001C838808|nr:MULTISPECIES: MFS transporter [Rhizobium]MBX4893832.1 MFS transporter [Rhizobium bangladeshense]MBX5014455.1 MFS transporter [Rhizobium lentis]
MSDVAAKRAVPALIGAVAAYSVALGAVYAALGVALKEGGHTSSAIAISAAMTPLGLMTSAAILSRFGRGSIFRWLIAGIVGTAATMIFHGILPFYPAWLVLRFLLGFVANILFLFGESALMMVLGDRQRGKILGTYNGLVTLGYATGPFLVAALAGVGPLGAVAACSVIVLCAIVPVIWAKAELDFLLPAREKTTGFLPLFAVAPALFIASSATAIFDNGFLALFPAYGIDSGLSSQHALFLLGVALVGATILQWPIGALCDRWGAALVLRFAAAITVATMLTLPYTIHISALAPIILFLAGGGAFGAYSAVLVLVSQRFAGHSLILAKALLSMMWGVGSFVGVPIIGASMDAIHLQAFGPAVVWPFILLTVLIFFQNRRPFMVIKNEPMEEHHAQEK